MRIPTPLLLAAGLFGASLGAAGTCAQDDAFPVPANTLALEDTGTLGGIQRNIVKFVDSNQDIWLLEIVPQTTVSIEGEADVEYLRPGLTVELEGEVKTDSSLAEPIKEIGVLNSKVRVVMGLFPPGDDADAKPVRNPEAGKYRIRGRIIRAKDGELLIAAGRLKITAKTNEETEVKLADADPSMAQLGDEMTVKAWYPEFARAAPNQLGKARAEAISIKLANPSADAKRSRGR